MSIEPRANGKGMEPQSSLRKLIPAAGGDEMLVAAAKGGDRSAFDKLVDRHKQKILLLAARIMRNREDAEEVAQDAFIQAFVHLEKFNGDSRFSTWLTRIAVNQALMMLRKKRQSREVSLDESTEAGEPSIPLQIPDRRPTPEQYASQRELQDVLGQALAELPANLRIAIELRDLQELTNEEATQVLGITVTAVKSRLFHARTRLRQVLSSRVQPKGQRTVGSSWKMPPLQPEVP